MIGARLLVAAAAIGVVAFRGELLGSDLAFVATVAMVSAALCILAVASHSTLGVWAGGFWYLIVLVLFHLGLAVPIAFGFDVPGDFGTYITTWFGSTSYRVEATYLSTVAVLACTAGYLFGHKRAIAPQRLLTASGEDVLGTALTVAGSALVLGYVALTNPSALLGISRQSYWETIAVSGVDAIGSFVVTFGGILLAASAPSRTRKVGLIALGIFGAWALMVGARGFIMYTVLAMLVTWARLHRMPRKRVAVAVVAVGLVVVSVVGFARTEGFGRTRFDVAAANPMNAVVEMGGSIRPLVENVRLARVGHEEPSHGMTYLGWAGRATDALLGRPRPPGELDPRLAGNELRYRTDGFQIGYSAVAEAFRNWRTPGVLAVFGLFGFALGRLDGWRLGHSLPAVYTGVVFYALIYHVRQPSIQLVPLLVAGALLVWFCAAFGRRQERAPRAGEPETSGRQRVYPDRPA